MKSIELRRLKVKLANLQSEIQYLIGKSEGEPELIDAISSDIADFTDEVTKITKEIDSIKEKKQQKESLNLVNLYEQIKDKENIKKEMSQLVIGAKQQLDIIKDLIKKEKGGI